VSICKGKELTFFPEELEASRKARKKEYRKVLIGLRVTSTTHHPFENMLKTPPPF